MSFITDIAALAKAGYTPQDVKDLLNLSKPQEPLKAEAQPAEQERTPQAESVQIITEPEKPVETSTKEIEQPTSEPDYKALYEAEQEKVKALQDKNNRKDLSGVNTTSEDELLDIIKSFC